VEREARRPGGVNAVSNKSATGAEGQLPSGPRRAQRRRTRLEQPRPHALLARLSDEEFELVAVAAAHVGLTTTGYVADTAVQVARGTVRPVPATTAQVVRELVDARTQLRRYGVLLNQAVAKLHATGEVAPGLLVAVQRCDAAVAALGGAVQRLGRDR